MSLTDKLHFIDWTLAHTTAAPEASVLLEYDTIGSI